ncbi:MAG: flavin reductase, partial [Treponemataceae bacterium]|nr:flavin reductase [Treponemataceae bacterium]
GVPKIYKYGVNVAATSFKQIKPEKMAKIEKDTTKLAQNILKNNGKVKPGFKTKGFFAIMRMLMKNPWNDTDGNYWKEHGWMGKSRPWK